MNKIEVETIYKMPFSKLHELVKDNPEMLAMALSLAWNMGVRFESDRLHKYYRSMLTRPGAVLYERN